MFGLMRKKTHMAKHVAQGEAYRWEIEAAQRQERLAKDELDRFVRGLVPYVAIDRDMASDMIKLVVVVDGYMVNRLPYMEIYSLLTKSFQSRICDLVHGHTDPRGDMRESQSEALRIGRSYR